MNFLWFLEGIRTTAGSGFFQFVTCFGQEAFLLTIICAFYWCIDKTFACQLGLTYFASGLAVQSLKITFRIPRPWILDPEFSPVQSAVPQATGYSFPSGHTQGGTCLFAPLALKTRKSFRKLLYISAFLLIGFSRMYLGVHTPKDVICAMLVSLAFSLIFAKYFSFFLQHIRTLTIILTLCALLVMIYAFILLHIDVLPAKYASDCIKASGAGLGFSAGLFLEQTKLRFTTETRTRTGQFLKLLFGLLSTAVFKLLLSSFGGSLPWKAFEYAFLVFWILFLYPSLFTAVCKKR